MNSFSYMFDDNDFFDDMISGVQHHNTNNTPSQHQQEVDFVLWATTPSVVPHETDENGSPVLHHRHSVVPNTTMSPGGGMEPPTSQFGMLLESIRLDNNTNKDDDDDSPAQKVKQRLFDAFTTANEYDAQGFLTPLCVEWLAQVEAHVSRKNPKPLEEGAILKSRREEDGKFDFSCGLCLSTNKVYKCREGVILHIRKKHEHYKPWTCLGCQMSFVRKTELKLHLARIHGNGIRPFKCGVPTCGFHKGFTSGIDLKRHIAQDHEDIVKACCSDQPIVESRFIFF